MKNNMKEKPIKIKYQGDYFWFQQNEDGSGAISPLEHCFKNGKLDFSKAFSSDTFAHVGTDRIMRRYRMELGKIDDFII